MKKSLRGKIITAATIMLGAIVFSFTVFFVGSAINAAYADEVFITKDNQVTVTKDYGIDASLGLSETRKGVLLSASSSGAKVDLSGEYCGTFEMNFRVVSDASFVQSGDITGDNIVNNALELREMKLHFSETESGESFDVIINGGSCMNFATPQASVFFEEQRRGVFLYNYNSTIRSDSANTTQANGAERYTALYGTSFSNTAYINDGTLAEAVSSTTIGFNPYTMEVYYLTDTGLKTLIWDMSKPEIDGQIASVLSPFLKYNVSIEFSDIAVNKTADMVVYSINGQNLNGTTFENMIGPNVIALYSLNAVKNNKFAVEKPVTFDVLGNFTTDIALTAYVNKKKISVYDKNGAVTDVYTDGCYVVPDMAGELEIAYVANDGTCSGNVFVANIDVFEVEPLVNYSISGTLESGVYGVGKEITLYNASASGDIFRFAPEVVVSVYKNRKVVSGYEKIKPTGSISLDSVGEYRIVYSCAGLRQTASFDLTVADSLVAFNYISEIPAVGIEGDVITLPQGMATYKGQSKTANLLVEYPDGGSYKSNVIELQQPGLYNVRYLAEFDGVTYEDNKNIIVSGKQATFTNSAGGIVTLNARNNRYAAMTGAYLKTNNTGSKFTYSEIINLSDATSQDSILKMYSAAGWGGGNGLPTIYLTDVHDASNVVTIHTQYGWHEYLNTGWAYATDQTEKAMNGSASPSGTEYWSPKDGWGTSIFYNSQEMISPAVPFENQYIDLRYDNTTKCLYFNRNGENALVIDLDADYQEIPWKGFTTGEVYLSFTGVKQAMVTEVYGNDFTVGAYYTDTKAPQIMVDTLGWAEQCLPVAVVGQPYRIFSANATDNWSKDVDVDVRVYYDYKTKNYTEISLKDGCFVPRKVGKYTIEYTSKDSFGNVCVKTITIDAVISDEVEKIVFSLQEDPAVSGFLGASYAIPQIANQSGGSSEVDFIIEIKEPDGTTLKVDKVFVPKKLGIHQLTYTAVDYSNNTMKKSYSFTVTASSAPIFADILLPKAILSGTKLKLPVCEAVDYSSKVAGEKLETQVSATLNDQLLSIENGTVVPTAAGTLKVVYSAKGANRTFEVTVVNPGNEEGFMANYLYDEAKAFTTEATEDGIVFTTSQSNAQIEFINPVLANDFLIKLAIPDVSKVNTDKITFWLTDSENANIEVRLDIVKKEGDSKNSYLSINGGAYRTIAGSLFNKNLPIGFLYKQESTVLMNLNGNAVGYLDNDCDFEGFTSGKVVVKIGVGEVSGEVSLMLTNLNNQTFSRSNKDVIVPEAGIAENIPLRVFLGSQLTIPSLIAQDVLAATVTVSVTVVKVGGSTLYKSETNESAILTISEAGKYRINYMVSDGGPLPMRLNYIVETYEDKPPVLEFKSQMKTEYNIGDKLQLPEFIVTDDSSTSPIVRIYMYFPNGSMWCLDNPEEMTFKQAGTYQLKFFVYDDYYNYVEEIFVITAR